jgi:nucleoside-diphosphate-sugar epimerase
VVDVGLPYNRSKVLGERAVSEWYQSGGLPVTVVRPVTIYGPRSKDIVGEIARLLVARQMVLINGGRSHAGLLYIDNAVNGLVKAAESPHTLGKAYNLRDDGHRTWREYVAALATGLGSESPRLNLPDRVALLIAFVMEKTHATFRIRSRPLLTRHAVYLLSRDQGYGIARAQEDFGFRSEVSFTQGIERTLSWLVSEEGGKALRQR